MILLSLIMLWQQDRCRLEENWLVHVFLSLSLSMYLYMCTRMRLCSFVKTTAFSKHKNAATHPASHWQFSSDMCLWLGIQAFGQASALQWYRPLVIVAPLHAIHKIGLYTVVLPIVRHLACVFEELVNINTMANESLRDVLY